MVFRSAAVPQRSYSLAVQTAGLLLVVFILQVQLSEVETPEIYSDLVCWTTISIAFLRPAPKLPSEARKSKDAEEKGNEEKKASSWDLWIAAVGVTVWNICGLWDDTTWIVPVLIPLLLGYREFVEVEHNHSGRYSQSRYRQEPSRKQYPRSVRIILATLVASTLVSIFATDYKDKAYGVAIVAGLALFGALAALIRLFSDPLPATRCMSWPRVAKSLSIRVSISLCVGLLFLKLKRPEVESETNISFVLFAGALKASQWILLISISSQAPVYILIGAQTFAFSITSGYIACASLPCSTAHVVTALLALIQTVLALPSSGRAGRSALVIFIALAALPLFQSRHPLDLINAFGHGPREHPVEVLTREAEMKFASLVRKQSKTLPAAITEYKRRNGREPPHGFDQWFYHAVNQNSTVIDDFDIVTENLKPFFEMTGLQVVKTIEEAFSALVKDDARAWRCPYRNGLINGDCGPIGRSIEKLMYEVKDHVPDCELLLNHLAQPRVFFPPDASVEVQLDGSEPIVWQDSSRQPIWDQIKWECEHRLTKKRKLPRRKLDGLGFPFVQDWQSFLDLCEHPEYAKKHGLLLSPDWFSYTFSAVPVISQAGISLTSDILLPSHLYRENYNLYEEDKDTEWEKKKNKLYWSDTSEGSYANNGYWREHHRQRFVTLSNNLQNRSVAYIGESPSGRLQRIDEARFSYNHYDVSFADIIQCEKNHCEDQRNYFQPSERRHAKAKAYQYRLVYDIDGNGHSPDFYRLLASNSLPLKTSIYREWHDERLIPWYHFVPVTLEMEELPELVRYFTSTASGRQRAREIAERGREWHERSLRPVDQQIYMWRLFLELARLQDLRRVREG